MPKTLFSFQSCKGTMRKTGWKATGVVYLSNNNIVKMASSVSTGGRFLVLVSWIGLGCYNEIADAIRVQTFKSTSLEKISVSSK